MTTGREAEEAPGGAGSRPEVPFLFLAGSTVFALVLGSFGNDIAKWIVCALSEGKCSEAARATALMLGTMLATFVAVYSAAAAGRTGEKTPKEADLMILGAMIGAFFALLKAAEGENGHPEIDILVRPLLVYVVASAVVLVPLAMARRGPSEGGKALRLVSRVVLAFLAATLLGGLLQATAQEIWSVAEDNGSVRKFVVAPVAPVIATAVFGTLMLHPLPGSRARRMAAIGWLAFATVAVVAFFLIGYLPEHGEDGWMAQEGLSSVRIGVFYCLLLLSGILMMATAAVAGLAAGDARSLLLLAVPFMLLAALCGYEVGEARLAADKLSTGDPLTLGLLHGLGPPLGLLAMLSGARLQSRFSRLYRDGPRDGGFRGR